MDGNKSDEGESVCDVDRDDIDGVATVCWTKPVIVMRTQRVPDAVPPVRKNAKEASRQRRARAVRTTERVTRSSKLGDEGLEAVLQASVAEATERARSKAEAKKQMADIAAMHRFSVMEVLEDGNCWCQALAIGIKSQTSELTELTTADAVRAMALAGFDSFATDLIAFFGWVGERAEEVPTMEDFRAEAAKVKHRGFWSNEGSTIGDLVLRAFSLAARIRICVLQSDGNVVVVGEDVESPRAMVTIGRYQTEVLHFCALIPVFVTPTDSMVPARDKAVVPAKRRRRRVICDDSDDESLSAVNNATTRALGVTVAKDSVPCFDAGDASSSAVVVSCSVTGTNDIVVPVTSETVTCDSVSTISNSIATGASVTTVREDDVDSTGQELVTVVSAFDEREVDWLTKSKRVWLQVVDREKLLKLASFHVSCHQKTVSRDSSELLQSFLRRCVLSEGRVPVRVSEEVLLLYFMSHSTVSVDLYNYVAMAPRTQCWTTLQCAIALLRIMDPQLHAISVDAGGISNVGIAAFVFSAVTRQRQRSCTLALCLKVAKRLLLLLAEDLEVRRLLERWCLNIIQAWKYDGGETVFLSPVTRQQRFRERPYLPLVRRYMNMCGDDSELSFSVVQATAEWKPIIAVPKVFNVKGRCDWPDVSVVGDKSLVQEMVIQWKPTGASKCLNLDGDREYDRVVCRKVATAVGLMAERVSVAWAAETETVSFSCASAADIARGFLSVDPSQHFLVIDTDDLMLALSDNAAVGNCGGRRNFWRSELHHWKVALTEEAIQQVAEVSARARTGGVTFKGEPLENIVSAFMV